MIQLDLSILNQKGTPMFNSDLLANRPSPAVVGRIFIAIDSPYGLFRDTGSVWEQIASAGGLDTNIYNTSGNLTGNRVVGSGGFSLTFNPSTTFASTLTAPTGSGAFAAIGLNTLSYASAFSSSNLGNVYAAIGGINLQTFAGSATFAQANLAAANISVNSVDFSAPGSTITMTQSTGLRVMAGHQNQIQYQGTNSGTITHAAISQNLGFFRPPGATGILTITNAYGQLINDLNDYGSGFIFTNRFGIFQSGASDTNFFNASVLIGTSVNAGFKLDVNGTARVSGDIRTQNGTTFTDLTANATSGLFLNALIPATFELKMFMNRFSQYNINIARGVVLGGVDQGTHVTATCDLSVRDLYSSVLNTRDINITTNGGTSSDNKFLTFQLAATNSNSDGAIRFRISSQGNAAIMGVSTRAGRNFDDFEFRIGAAAVDLNTGTLAYRINGSSGNFIIGSVGTNVASAILNVDSTTRGLLPPRMTNAQILAIATPAEGLMAYNTTISQMCVYQAGAWRKLSNTNM